jgi:hypothetical protein
MLPIVFWNGLHMLAGNAGVLSGVLFNLRIRF